ncbi:MAG: hypothetical protein KJZ53_02215 [Anaerolineales bacterium]|nr:hypothetical protein [Anaerolineales bacterium]
MQTPTPRLQAVQISQHVFAGLLRLYPREYRQAYGTHMAQLFADCSREAAGQSSAAALLALWASTLLDVCKTALEERIKEIWTMNAQQIHRRGSLLLLAGAALMPLVISTGRLEQTYDDPLGGPDGWIEYTRLIGLPLSYLLMTAGAWQLHRSEVKGASFARAALLVSTAAAVLTMIGFLGFKATGINNIGLLQFYGNFVYLVGLGVFGLALRAKSPGAASLITLGGLLLPALFLIGVGTREYWWLRGGAISFKLQTWVDLMNASNLLVPAILCFAAVLLLRTRPAHASH